MRRLATALALGADGWTVALAVAERTPKGLALWAPERLHDGPGYPATARRIEQLGGHPERLAWHTGQAGVLILDAGHYSHGRILRDAIRASAPIRRWAPRVEPVELVASGIGRPEPDGWRWKVARRDVISAWIEVATAKRVRMEAGPVSAEAQKQLGQIREKEEPEQRDGELARAVLLAVWYMGLRR